MTVIEITDLQHRYGRGASPAVDGLDLRVDQGQVLGLLGPNGAGKSTTLAILCGLLRPTRGTVKVLGADVVRDTRAAQRHLGLVPQEIALYPFLTGRENLSFFGRMLGLRGAVLRERVAWALDLAALGAASERRVRTWSGGMKRRLNVVTALLHRPPVLVLDEPMVGIDAQSRGAILALLEHQASQGTAMVYATHQMEQAARLCHEVVIIDLGKALVRGRPERLVAETEGCADLEEVFLSLTGRHLRDGP